MVVISFKPKYLRIIMPSFCLAADRNEQNPREGTFDLSFFFRYKHITSLKNHH